MTQKQKQCIFIYTTDLSESKRRYQTPLAKTRKRDGQNASQKHTHTKTRPKESKQTESMTPLNLSSLFFVCCQKSELLLFVVDIVFSLLSTQSAYVALVFGLSRGHGWHMQGTAGGSELTVFGIFCSGTISVLSCLSVTYIEKTHPHPEPILVFFSVLF
jgi:hypothetical protein